MERIERHRNARRLPRIPLDTHRYYLAHSPRGMFPVLRLKDEKGLADWRTRKWDSLLFPDPPPNIEDVTVQVLELLESVLDLPQGDFQRAEARVLVEEGWRLVVVTSGEPPTRFARPLWAAYEGIAAALVPDIFGRAPGRVWSIIPGDYGYEEWNVAAEAAGF